MTATKPELRIVGYVGNTIRHTFEIRRFREKGRIDVSAATFEITWEDSTGEHKPKLTLSPVTPDANWADGLVVAEFTPSDFTAEEDVYTFALWMFLNGVEEIVETGFFETRESPGHPPP